MPPLAEASPAEYLRGWGVGRVMTQVACRVVCALPPTHTASATLPPHLYQARRTPMLGQDTTSLLWVGVGGGSHMQPHAWGSPGARLLCTKIIATLMRLHPGQDVSGEPRCAGSGASGLASWRGWGVGWVAKAPRCVASPPPSPPQAWTRGTCSGGLGLGRTPTCLDCGGPPITYAGGSSPPPLTALGTILTIRPGPPSCASR